MRAHEFLTEHTSEEDIRSQLATTLIALHASEIPSVSIKQLRKSLERAGYFVNKQWIQDSSRQLGIVKDVDDSTVTLDVETNEPEPTAPDADADEQKVAKMAKKALARRKS